MIEKEYWCLIWNMNMQSASSIWSNLLSNVKIIEIVHNCVLASGEANVYDHHIIEILGLLSFKQDALSHIIKEKLWKIAVDA